MRSTSLRRAETKRHALVQLLWHQVENPVDAVGRGTAGLLDQKGDRVGLVDETQATLAITLAAVGGIAEHAAAHQDAIGVGDQRGDPAHVEVALARTFRALQAVIDIEPDRFVPMPVVGRIDGKLRRARRNDAALMQLDECAHAGREAEDMRSAAQREHQRELRAIDEKAGRKLLVPRLEKSGGGIVARAAQGWEHGEDRADRDVGLDVRRTVERVDCNRQRRVLVEQHRLIQFFRNIERDRRVTHGVEKDVIGENVEVLLGVAVGIGATIRCPGRCAERALVDRVADTDRGARHLPDGLHDRGAEAVIGTGIRIQERVERGRGHVNLPNRHPAYGVGSRVI